MLEEYELRADVTTEFSSAGLLLGEYWDAAPPFVTAWWHFGEEIVDMTVQGFNAGNVYSSRKKFT